MRRINVTALTLASSALLLCAAAAHATEPMASPASVSSVALSASLVDVDKHAAKGGAVVSVKVTGVTLTDPAMANEVPKAGQAHLHYQVDQGPVIATTAPKLSFHDLSPGEHTVVVMLAANDHSPLGPKETLSVVVPSR